jgi:hypothetical protein
MLPAENANFQSINLVEAYEEAVGLQIHTEEKHQVRQLAAKLSEVTSRPHDTESALLRANRSFAWYNKKRRDLEAECRRTKKSLEMEASVCRHFNRGTHKVVWRWFIAQAHCHEKEIRPLQKKVNETTRKYDLVFGAWQDVIQELEELKLQRSSLLVADDDEITSKWMHIQFAIKNVSSLYPYTEGAYKCLTTQDRARFRLLLPIFGHPTDEIAVGYLPQCHIWNFITEKILAVPTTVWGEELSSSANKFFALFNGK